MKVAVGLLGTRVVAMADLDDMLDEVANEQFKAPVKKQEPTEMKAWLAFTANVTPEIRDKWTSLVRKDLPATVMTRFQPSNAYRKWDSLSGTSSSTKLLQETIRAAASRAGLDEAKTAKLLTMISPTDPDQYNAIQAAYKKQLFQELRATIRSDINFIPAKFPNLASV